MTDKNIFDVYPKYAKVDNIFESIKNNGDDLKPITKTQFEEEYTICPLDSVENTQ